MSVTSPEPLSEKHDFNNFDCGEEVLNNWLRRKAIRNEQSGASRTYVVCHKDKVIGYYCLATGSIINRAAPGKIRRNMPDPIPVMVLGRLAIDNKWQQQGIGAGLLKDAVQRTIIVAKQVGVRALLVHTLSEDAKSFYIKYGFCESPIDSMTLMISLTTQ